MQQHELPVEQRVGERPALAQPRQPLVGFAPREHQAHRGVQPGALLFIARLTGGVREPERVIVLQLERLHLGHVALEELGEFALARARGGSGRRHEGVLRWDATG